MRLFYLSLALILNTALFAQERAIYSVYFDTAIFNLKDVQAKDLLDFVKSKDSARIESIHIFGYCDDIGKDKYNLDLSNNRANTVKNNFTANGIKSKIIIVIEGKGSVLIDDKLIENLPEIRSKNRRVDVVLYLKPLPKEDLKITEVYTSFPEKTVKGDRIMLDRVFFNRGSSVLDAKSKKELDVVAAFLLKNKTVHIEIQGHVCCLPSFHKEAIDRVTKKRTLSHNRAETVYNYFLLKKIDAKRLTFKGYGNAFPLGKDPELDKRVELVVTKN